MRLKTFISIILLSVGSLFGFNVDSLEVSFVNFYPGSEIYELEGHSVLRLQYKDSLDVMISYGMFDYNEPNFVYRFVKGETDYWVAMIDTDIFVRSYISQGRTISEHSIIMDSAQKRKLLDLLNVNLLPQNSVYRYNYVKDNCATRPLKMLQDAYGDTIKLQEPENEGAKCRSYRDVMRLYHRNYPWYQFGIDIALGQGIDYDLTPNEKAFAPIVLEHQLANATVGGKKISGPGRLIFEGKDVVLGATPWYATPIFVFSVLFVIVLVITIHDIRTRRVTKWLDAILFSIFGLVGLLLTFLIFISSHEATSPNWLYLWLNPLCLIVPIFIWLKKCKIVVMSYQIANFAFIIVMAIIWPIVGQSGNVAFLPLIGCDLLRSFSYVYIYQKNRNKK